VSRVAVALGLVAAGCGRPTMSSTLSDRELIELSPARPTVELIVGLELDEPGPPRPARIVDGGIYVAGEVVHYVDACREAPCGAELRLQSLDATVDDTSFSQMTAAGQSHRWHLQLGAPLECRPRRPCALERSYELSYTGQDLIVLDLVAGWWLESRSRRQPAPDGMRTWLDVLDP